VIVVRPRLARCCIDVWGEGAAGCSTRFKLSHTHLQTHGGEQKSASKMHENPSRTTYSTQRPLAA